MIIILRPDQQDYQGTHVTVEVARRLHVPHMMLMVNKAPQALNPQQVMEQVSSTYGCEVAAVLPHSDEMMNLASMGIFSLHHPTHPIMDQLRRTAKMVTEAI